MSVCIEHNNHFYQQLPASECFTTSEKTSSFDKINTILKVWIQNSKQRKQLANLDEHLLKDIGYTAEEAHYESRKPFWS